MKYINAEKLIEEVKALKRRKGFLPFENTEITEAYMARGVQFTCDDIVNLIQSLQQEQQEVDLVEEINRFLSNATMINKGEWKGKYPISKMGFSVVANHFFNLGLNARK